jgi:hypothetical protein
LIQLAEGVSALAAWTRPADLLPVGDIVLEAMNVTTDDAVPPLAMTLAVLAARLAPEDAAKVFVLADPLISRATRKAQQSSSSQLRRSWLALLAHETPTALLQRELSVAGTIGALHDSTVILAVPVMLRAAFEQPSQPLPAQVLVDLLKNPLYLGWSRDIVLQQLSRHYNHSFKDVWDLVRIAGEQNLRLDFISPPKRPQPRAERASPR